MKCAVQIILTLTLGFLPCIGRALQSYSTCDKSKELESIFFTSLYNNDLSYAATTFNTLIDSIPGKCLSYKNEYSPRDLIHYTNAVNFWEVHQKEKSMCHIFNITVLLINTLDISYTNGSGKFVNVKGRYSPDSLESIKKAHQLLKKMYFYFSGGKILLEFQYQYLKKSTITQAVLKPYREKGKYFLMIDYRSIRPYPEKLIRSINQNTDCYMIYIPQAPTGSSVSGFINISLNGKSQYSSERKGLITLSMKRGSLPQTLIHEMFHIFENMIQFKEKHSYETDKKDDWPEWYRGQGQLEYYQLFFQQEIKDPGIIYHIID